MITSIDSLNLYLLKFSFSVLSKFHLIVNLFFLLAFTSNADVDKFLFFGKGIEVWLVYTLIFFGLTSIAFVVTWLSALPFENNQEDEINF